MQFRPLHDRVLVRRIEAEEKSAGGIIIPRYRVTPQRFKKFFGIKSA